MDADNRMWIPFAITSSGTVQTGVFDFPDELVRLGSFPLLSLFRLLSSVFSVRG